MRDSQVLEMQARRDEVVFGQLEFLVKRQEAVERLLTVSSLKDRLMWIVWPSLYMKVVDAVHLTLMQEAKNKRKEAAIKPKILVADGVSL